MWKVKPSIKKRPCTRDGISGVLIVETSTGKRPEYRFGWDLYSHDTKKGIRVWDLELFVPDEVLLDKPP